MNLLLRRFTPQYLLLSYLFGPKALMSTKCEEGLRGLESNQEFHVQSVACYQLHHPAKLTTFIHTFKYFLMAIQLAVTPKPTPAANWINTISQRLPIK